MENLPFILKHMDLIICGWVVGGITNQPIDAYLHVQNSEVHKVPLHVLCVEVHEGTRREGWVRGPHVSGDIRSISLQA